MKIAVINQKGGVGKSTISANLAYGLAVIGKKTLLVDMDPQGHSCDIYCSNFLESQTMSEVMRDTRYDIKNSIFSAHVNGRVVDNLFVIPSDIRLAETKEAIYGRTHVLKFLDKQLEKIVDSYQYIVIDCPPDLGALTKNAVYTADKILIPIDFDRKALKGVVGLFNTISEVKENDHYDYRIIRNLYDTRETIINQYIESELTPYREKVMKIRLHRAAVLKQAGANGEPIFTFDPKSSVVKDYRELVMEVIND